MKNFVIILQVIVSVGLVALILLQRRGTGLSGVFGGEGGSWQERRGLEKFIFWATILLAVLFIATSLVALALAR